MYQFWFMCLGDGSAVFTTLPFSTAWWIGYNSVLAKAVVCLASSHLPCLFGVFFPFPFGFGCWIYCSYAIKDQFTFTVLCVCPSLRPCSYAQCNWLAASGTLCFAFATVCEYFKSNYVHCEDHLWILFLSPIVFILLHRGYGVSFHFFKF